MKKPDKSTRSPMTVLIDSDLRRALRLKRAEDGISISDTVNDSIREAFRKNPPTIPLITADSMQSA